MAIDKNKNEVISVEQRLKSLYELQTILSEIDRIKTIRGELPLEVKDLEDNIEGLRTRIENYRRDVEDLRKKTVIEKEKINESQSKIARYKEQLDNVRNNREFDLLSKEVEFQTLEIELCEKHLNEYARAIDTKTNEIAATEERLKDSEHILKEKQTELDEIVSETRSGRRAPPHPGKGNRAAYRRAHTQGVQAYPRQRPPTVSASCIYSVTPAEVASTAYRLRSRWKSRCTRKSSYVNTAAVS